MRIGYQEYGYTEREVGLTDMRYGNAVDGKPFGGARVAG